MSELIDFIPEEEQAFTIKDDGTAEWCLQKIKEAEADRAKWKAHYEAQMEKVNETADSVVAYFTDKLEEYFSIVPHKAAKASESYALPSGKLIRKKQQPEYTRDDEKLVPWLKQNFMGQLVKVKESADWASLKSLVHVTPDGANVATDDGEIVPGVAVTPRPDVFKIEMGG